MNVTMHRSFTVGFALVLSSMTGIAQAQSVITVDPIAVLSADHTQAAVSGTLTCNGAYFSATIAVELFQPVLAATPIATGSTFIANCDGVPRPYSLVVSAAGGTLTPGPARADASMDDSHDISTSTTLITLVDPPPSVPTSKDQCKNGGWQTFGGAFKNQGECVKFVASGGKT
jgi:hypothetical protein